MWSIVLSNGNPDILDILLSQPELEIVVRYRISAVDIGLYKPDQRLYRPVVAEVDAVVSEIAHVTSAWRDVVTNTVHTHTINELCRLSEKVIFCIDIYLNNIGALSYFLREDFIELLTFTTL